MGGKYIYKKNVKISVKRIKQKTQRHYLLLKEVPLFKGECICLGNDWDDVDHFTETPHEFHIKRSQTEKTKAEKEMRKRDRNVKTLQISSTRGLQTRS